MPRLSITDEVHNFLSTKIGEGDMVIDATLGNGHDALFLTREIGERGHLFGFDIQAEAIKHTLNRLTAHQLDQRATLVMKSHEYMADLIPAEFHGRIKCIMFNLGYLPGADKQITTKTESTLAALAHSCELLAHGGYISILAYTGHPGGLEECRTLKDWAGKLEKGRFSLSIKNLLPDHKNPPQWIVITKKG